MFYMGSLTLREEYTLRILKLFTVCTLDQYTHLLQPTKYRISVHTLAVEHFMYCAIEK